MIDEGVAVVLYAIDRLIALRLKCAHRVVAVPFQQLADGPRSQVLVTAVSEHGTAFALSPGTHLVHVAHHHIEISTREVTLVFVGDLKHRACIAAVGATSQLAGTPRRAVGTVTEGIVATLGIYPSVHRIDVEQVGVHRVGIFFSSAPPAVGYRVFTVIAVTKAVIGTTLASLIGILRGGITVNDDVVLAVGCLELRPQVPVKDLVMAVDFLVQ